MIKIASWNVNSLKVRLEQVLQWLETSNTDILALQETKVTDEYFPKQAFHDAGFHIVFSGQKTYNGVAIISKHPIEKVMMDIEDYPDPSRRILIASIANLRVINLYVPNGYMVGSDKYHYKLQWLEKITAHIKEELAHNPKTIILGDFNIAPENEDVHSIEEWAESVLVSEPERQAFANLLQLGLKDSFRNFERSESQYSWWDYRAGSFRRNRGLRIDHILLSSTLNSVCKACEIDTEPRRSERPSDHAPVWVALDL